MNKTQSLSLTFTSANADLVSPDKDNFTVFLSPPIEVPQEAKNCYLKVLQATVWNSSPNVIDGKNNLLIVRETNTDPWTTLTIPSGQYGVSGLNSAISRELQNAGLSSTLVQIAADNATQRVQVTFETTQVQLDFTVANTLKDILGFNAVIITGNPQVQLADNVAEFNTINAFRIHSDIIDKGILYNGNSDNTIIAVPIIAPPGSQIVYSPFVPLPLSAARMIGQRIQSVNVYITDELNRPIVVLEDWSILIEINYQF